MNDQEPKSECHCKKWHSQSSLAHEAKPKCCCECLYFQIKTPFMTGRCKAPAPWWMDLHQFNYEIRIPETLAQNCPCFTPKP